jgi:hypothetical protein
VDHGLTAYRAHAFVPAAPSVAVRWVLNRVDEARSTLCRNARKCAVSLFNAKFIAERNRRLYSRILDGNWP